MPRRESYRPQHRAEPADPATEAGRRRPRRSMLMLSALAVTATGFAVSSGVNAPQDDPVAPAQAAQLAGADTRSQTGSVAEVGVDLGDRIVAVSRSARRSPVDPAKARALSQESGGQVARTEDLSSRDPRDIARRLLPEFGYGQDQFSCLDDLYVGESNWDVHADNPTSSAYGIPQALPGSKMASAGADWEDNPETQIRWGLGYIKGRYGTPCSALGFKNANNWY